MRLLVTGAAGEVGFGVLAALDASVRAGLRAPPESVVALDAVARERQSDFAFPVQWQTLDLLEGDLAGLVRDGGIEACIHCAGLTGERAEADLPATLAANLDATRRLADALAAAGRSSRLLLAGALAAIGHFDGPGAADESAPLRPRSHYGASKAMAELYLEAVRRSGVLDARVLRLPTLLVRTAQRTGRPSTGYLSDLAKAVRDGRPIVLPAPEDFPVAVASRTVAAEALLRAVALDPKDWGAPAVANLPAFPLSARQLVDALAPTAAVAVQSEPDAALLERVGAWPTALISRLTEALVPPAGRERSATLDVILAEALDGGGGQHAPADRADG